MARNALTGKPDVELLIAEKPSEDEYALRKTAAPKDIVNAPLPVVAAIPSTKPVFIKWQPPKSFLHQHHNRHHNATARNNHNNALDSSSSSQQMQPMTTTEIGSVNTAMIGGDTKVATPSQPIAGKKNKKNHRVIPVAPIRYKSTI